MNPKSHTFIISVLGILGIIQAVLYHMTMTTYQKMPNCVVDVDQIEIQRGMKVLYLQNNKFETSENGGTIIDNISMQDDTKFYILRDARTGSLITDSGESEPKKFVEDELMFVENDRESFAPKYFKNDGKDRSIFISNMRTILVMFTVLIVFAFTSLYLKVTSSTNPLRRRFIESDTALNMLYSSIIMIIGIMTYISAAKSNSALVDPSKDSKATPESTRLIDSASS